jgi:DNA-binding Lrp family transcriptional regulator
MYFTNRDQHLLSDLGNYGLLSTTIIVEKHFNNADYSTVLRRLRILEKEGLIRRAGLLMTTENIWAIAPKGAKKMSLENFKCYWNQASIDHDFKLIKLRMFLEELGIIKKWIAEHVIRSMIYKKYSLRDAKNKLIPDGIFETKIDNSSQSLAIELELNLKSQSRYKKILGQYQWNKDLLGVWYIVPTLAILNKLKDYWNRTMSSYTEGKIYFSLLDDLLTFKGESLLYSTNEKFLLKEFFKIPAHQTAQEVVTIFERPLQNDYRLTTSDHTPIIGHPN